MSTNGVMVLYIGSSCPYCARVTDYLSTQKHNIVIKDVWADEHAMQELVAMTDGKRTVPCLRMDDEYMHESLDIIDHLKKVL